jgi:hypothetical protein
VVISLRSLFHELRFLIIFVFDCLCIVVTICYLLNIVSCAIFQLENPVESNYSCIKVVCLLASYRFIRSVRAISPLLASVSNLFYILAYMRSHDLLYDVLHYFALENSNHEKDGFLIHLSVIHSLL